MQNLRARTGISKVKKSLDQRMAAMREARKIALMQKRYGYNWITEMNSDQSQSGADLKEMFELIDEVMRASKMYVNISHAWFLNDRLYRMGPGCWIGTSCPSSPISSEKSR